ncbi:MAG: hypothetical protein A2X36_12810 [Elusimicrobia bacterium GWA2_69_24]|nr:MAG: hypothetical protein A2X36_12810 [Elusimicrobia bacterium GWA2_69_24]HBL17209.1 hypothetical protein [Elusimicrobiota bacterium]
MTKFGRFDFSGITRRRLLIAAAWVALVGLVVLGGMVHYSETPNFCNSCHIMKPYYDAWQGSKHNKIRCVECHYPPAAPRTLIWKKFQAMSQVVKYVTRTYSSKPFAEVEDASCLRSGCHSARLLEGRVVTPRKIRFDHRPHLSQVRRGRQLRCVSCHSQVVVGKHIEVTYDTCFLCHFKGRGEGKDLKPLGGCLGCHELPTGAFRIGNMTYRHTDFVIKQGVSCGNCHLDVVRGKGEAPKDRCFTCHNQPEKLAHYGDSPFLHENHVTKHNIACFHCHQEMTHGHPEAAALPSISGSTATAAAPMPAAHAGAALTFECSYCHQGKHAGQLEMYSGKAAALGLPEMPSPMYLASVDCVGCHYAETASGIEAEFTGKTEKASEKSCVKCHGPKFKDILEETRTELRKTIAEVSAKGLAARGAVAESELKGKERTALSAALGRAERQVRFVQAARGDHNVYLASEALRRADRTYSEAGSKTGAELADLSALPLLSGGYCATMCHPKLGVKIPPETVKAFGKTMPHKAHTDMKGCVACHELGTHKVAPLRKDVKTTCRECHPDMK